MKQLMISLLLLLSCFSVQAQEKSGSREVTKVKKLGSSQILVQSPNFYMKEQYF